MTNIIATIKNPFTLQNQNNPVSLKNNQASVNQNYLSHLLDVSIPNPVDGQVLTYNANTGKYDLAPVTATINGATVDGGSF
jgi:hypothetical protein